MEALNEDVNKLERNEDFVQYMLFENALFDVNTIIVGDYVSSMKYIGMEGKSRYRFTGEKVVNGYFNISYNDDYWGGDVITFNVENRYELPRANEDYRILWFMFSNYDEAFDMLSEHGDNGYITIVIDEYEIDLLQSDIVNVARLVDVVVD